MAEPFDIDHVAEQVWSGNKDIRDALEDAFDAGYDKALEVYR